MSSSKKYPYLKVLSLINKELDSQQEKACCRTNNSIVAAGAGSGKTQVLATRFAWLLMEDDNLHASNILTLTFTKKAAAEMYGRIYTTLKLFESSPEVPERQRKNAKRALEEYSTVHIQTLDSYCSSILRQCANRYGIKPDFSTGGSDGASKIKQSALIFLMKNLNRPGIKNFCDAADIQNFSDSVFSKIIIKHTTLATEKNYFKSFILRQKKIIVDMWNKLCSQDGTEGIFYSLSCLMDIFKMEENQKAASKNKIKVFIDSLSNLPKTSVLIDEQTFTDFTKRNEAVSFAQKILSSVLEEFGSSKIERQDDAEKLNEKIQTQKNLIATLCSYLKDYDSFVDLLELLDEFTAIVNNQKRASGNLTFLDVSELSLKILIEQKDIRTQEKTAYKKIMIDEFQDNNGKNRDLLFLLSEKDDVYTEISSRQNIETLLKNNLCSDKLYFVGDEKQSIYKFRGAEVDVFNNLKNTLKEINGPESYSQMIYNYRSDPELLTSFNILFGAIDSSVNKMSGRKGIFENVNESYEASYSSASYAKYVNENHEEMPPVELTAENVKSHVCLLLENNSYDEVKNQLPSNNQEIIAFFLADKIRKLHEEKNVPYSKIAILDRNRNDRHFYTRYLEQFNIPYKLDSQSKLFSDGVVNDVYNFLKLCVYPTDINAFAAYLCSPLCGISVEQLEIVLCSQNYIRDKNESFNILNDEALNKIYFALENQTECLNRVKKALEFYTENRQKYLSQPISSTLNDLWYKCGYRYETLLNKNVNGFEEHYDLLFALACKCDSEGKTVAWFVDELSVQKENEKKSFDAADIELDFSEIDYPLEKTDSVQYMTIHKSKGLQFDYVFLLGITGECRIEKGGKFSFDEENGLSVSSSSKGTIFQLMDAELSLKKNIAELRRLIYVGITRAVKEYTVLGNQKFVENGSKLKSAENTIFKDVLYQYYDVTSSAVNSAMNPIYAENAPFDFQIIPPLTKDIIYSQKNISLENQRAEKINSFTKEFSRLKSENKIQSEIFDEVKRVSPSDLEHGDFNLNSNSLILFNEDFSPLEISASLDKILSEEISNGEYSYDKLGTLVHSYFEMKIKKLPQEQIEKSIKYNLKSFKEEKQNKIYEILKLMFENFSSTDLGKKSVSLSSKSELEFKTCIADYLVTGSIDLVFKTEENKIIIIDYKTDHKVEYEKYLGQQTCYKKAVADIYDIDLEKIENWLYFVRFNKFINISAETNIEITAENIKSVIDSINEEKSVVNGKNRV